MLRYKHQLQVTQCSLSHGGYIVSNRMVAERKLHSGKVLSCVMERGLNMSAFCWLYVTRNWHVKSWNENSIVCTLEHSVCDLVLTEGLGTRLCVIVHLLFSQVM